MKLKRTTEDYLKTIYILSHKFGGVRSVRIAEQLGVTRPTVCVVIKRLIVDNLVYMDSEHEIYLTETGREIAEKITERYRTITELLFDMGVDEKIAARDACELEHGFSSETFAVLKAMWKGREESKKYDD